MAWYSLRSHFHSKTKLIRTLISMLISRLLLISFSALCGVHLSFVLTSRWREDMQLHAGRGRAWSKSDTEVLLSLRAQGFSLADIAQRLNRTTTACRSRYTSRRPHLQWPDILRRRVLAAAVSLGEDWEAVARVTNRTAHHCRLFYLETLRNQRSDPWSAAEDSLLLQLCRFHSELHQEVLASVSWNNLSFSLNRPSIACRRRYCSLATGRSSERLSDVWHESEYRRLRDLVERWGMRWSTIGKTNSSLSLGL